MEKDDADIIIGLLTLAVHASRDRCLVDAEYPFIGLVDWHDDDADIDGQPIKLDAWHDGMDLDRRVLCRGLELIADFMVAMARHQRDADQAILLKYHEGEWIPAEWAADHSGSSM